MPDKQHIRDSLAAIARGAGRAPSRSEFLSLSGISEHYISQFFPSWNEAVKAAGLDPFTLNVRLEDGELLEDWRHTVRKNGKIPARCAYHHLGKYDRRTIERRFGPWSKLPDIFRTFAEGKPEWADVVALLPVPKPNSSPKPAPGPLLNDDCRPCSGRASGRPIVSKNEFPPSSAPPNQAPPNKTLPNKVRYPPLEDRPTYGNPIDFRGLRHEPVNEQGVVLLFGLVAPKNSATSSKLFNPDSLTAKPSARYQRWQRVHIEFEFESRNFRDHGHPLTGCDIIVCWRHNWPLCPAQIEILELSSLIKSLPTSADCGLSYGDCKRRSS